jgi:hypothetical protein
MFNFLQNTIVFDGFVSALSFFKSYISFKMNTPLNYNSDENQNDIIYTKIINKSNIYNLPIVERYLIYGISSLSLYGILNFINLFVDIYEFTEIENIIINYSLPTIISIPYIQNFIFKSKNVDKYINKRNLFFRYSFAKLVLKYISQLNKNITGIQNYHTFILSKYIKLDLIKKTFKTFLFISLLHLLRDNETTYYYYKAIKLSYFYNKGYLFNVINKEYAVNIINEIVREKKWKEISNEENSNAFYCLIIDNMSNNIKINKTFLNIILLFFLSLWSIFCFINLMSLHLMAISIYSIICIVGIIFEIFTIKFVKKILISGIFSFLLGYYVYMNELIITIIYFCMIYNTIPLYVINEITFYVRNHKNIEKVVEFYNKKEL